MRKQTKAEKLVDARINHAFNKNCSGVQIGVMDIGKIFNHGRMVVAAGANDDELAGKIVAFVNTIRKN